MPLLRFLFSGLWLWIIRWRLERALRTAQAARGSSDTRPLIFVFGDSLSDAGNVQEMLRWLGAGSRTPSPPFHQGRLTDGPNWVDRVAAEMGFESEAAWRGGSNFAHAGAQTGSGLSSLVAIVPNLGEQIAFFTALRKSFRPTDWIVLLGGHNDLLATMRSQDSIPASTAAGHVLDHLERVHRLRGRQLIVPTLLPLDRAPEVPADKRDFVRDWTADFHRELAARLDAFRNAHPDVRLIAPDFARVMNIILDDPASYGFENASTPCYDSVSRKLGGDRTTWFWLDECHPTARVHQAFAACALEQKRAGDVAQ